MGSAMTEPCQFQGAIMKHGEDIAKQGESIDNMTATLKGIADNVAIITDKLSSMRGFVAGAAAAGGAIVAAVLWLASKLPVALSALIK